MEHTTVSRLQHVPQAYILCCACRWNDLAILSLEEAEKELKHNGTYVAEKYYSRNIPHRVSYWEDWQHD